MMSVVTVLYMRTTLTVWNLLAAGAQTASCRVDVTASQRADRADDDDVRST